MGRKRTKSSKITENEGEKCWSNLLEMMKKSTLTRHDLSMPDSIKKSILDLLTYIKSNLEMKKSDKHETYGILYELSLTEEEAKDHLENDNKIIESYDTKPKLLLHNDLIKELEEQVHICQKIKIKQDLKFMKFTAKFLNSSAQITNDIIILRNNLDHLKTILKNEDYSLRTRNIWEACKNGPLAAVQFWLYHRPALKEEYENQKTSYAPIHLAVKNGKKDIVEYLLANGAQINLETNIYKKTVIHIACENGDLDMVKFLVQNDADPKASDANNRNAIHYAVMSKSENLLKYLFELNILGIQEDIDKISPIALAKLLGYRQIIDLLEVFTKIQKEMVNQLPIDAPQQSQNEGLPESIDEINAQASLEEESQQQQQQQQ